MLALSMLMAPGARAHTRAGTWASFKRAYGKTYTVEEEASRFDIFMANLAFIERENAKGLAYNLGIGPFADMTEAEFVAQKTGKPTGPRAFDASHLGERYPSPAERINLMSGALDWTTRGVVTPVKDQSHCGSCWAFSSTGALESAYAIKTGTLLSLAEQELVDCMMVNKTTGIGEGCAGGWPYDAMKFAETYDFCTEETYPYTATDGRCALSTGKGCSVGLKAGTVTGYVSVPKNETGFLASIAIMPLSITVKAEANLQHYKSGVISVPCNGSDINHAVLAVGFGFEVIKGARYPYYKVKNSWGEAYGDQGYFKMSRDDAVNSNCVYNEPPVYPILT